MWSVLGDIWRHWPWTELMEQRTREVLYWRCLVFVLTVMLFGVWIICDSETRYRIDSVEIVAADTYCLSVTQGARSRTPSRKA
jgi:hypothetical protein